MAQHRGLIIGIIALLALLVVGTFGYAVIEGWGPFLAFYMTIITLSTVGYAEVAPMSDAGRLFTSLLILFGLGAMFYTVTAVFGYLVEQGFRGTRKRRSMERNIARLTDHYIICGYGRVGEEVAAIISRTGSPLVVVDISAVAVERAIASGLLALVGNASSDAVLKKVGINHARAVVAAAPTDAENVFITLSAKQANHDVYVVARARSEDAVPKLESAGANKVIMPVKIGGKYMAMMAMRPLLVSFIDTYFGRPSNPLELEDIIVTEDSPAANKTVAEVEGDLGLTVLALRKSDNRVFPKPGEHLEVEAGDELVVLGARKQLEQVEAEPE